MQTTKTKLFWIRINGNVYLNINQLVASYNIAFGVKYVINELQDSGEKYVTLEQLDEINFFMGEEDERKENIRELNRVLEKYEINNDLRISFFMGQVMHESRSGARTLETFNGDDPEKYFNEEYSNNFENLGNLGGNDGEHFRGAGYLHVTGRYNYQNFADYIGDQQVVEQGYRILGGVYNRPIEEIDAGDVGVIDIGKYAWEASGWFWRYGSPHGENLNIYADNKDWKSISSAINLRDTDKLGVRNSYINAYYEMMTGQSLGLPIKNI